MILVSGTLGCVNVKIHARKNSLGHQVSKMKIPVLFALCRFSWQTFTNFPKSTVSPTSGINSPRKMDVTPRLNVIYLRTF